jgi:hypothetical protein
MSDTNDNDSFTKQFRISGGIIPFKQVSKKVCK